MTRRSLGSLVLSTLLLVPAGFAASGTDQAKGRFKQQGDACVWDANDDGPNQCTPRVKGRFKKSNDSCTWDANDVGDNQCRPVKGRWKKSENSCTWDAKDEGPDQCNPRQPRK